MELAALFTALGPLVARLVLAMLRLFPLTLLLPVLSPRTVPAAGRLPLLAVLAVGVAPGVLDPASPRVALDPWLLVLGLRELALGVTLGLTLAAPFFALEHGGRLVDLARGANAAELTSPDSGARSSPLAELLRWGFTVVFLSAGGLRALLRCVGESFLLWPLGARAWPTASLVELAARWTQVSLEAALGLVSAALLSLLGVEATFALASRVSPPLAQSQLAVPVRALVPLAMLALSVGLWTGAAQELAAHAIRAVELAGGR